MKVIPIPILLLILNLWKSYSKKNSYAKNIEVDQIMLLLNDFIKELNLELSS